MAGHAQGLGYSAVIGYSETTSICDNLCILSATGEVKGGGGVFKKKSKGKDELVCSVIAHSSP